MMLNAWRYILVIVFVTLLVTLPVAAAPDDRGNRGGAGTPAIRETGQSPDSVRNLGSPDTNRTAFQEERQQVREENKLNRTAVADTTRIRETNRGQQQEYSDRPANNTPVRAGWTKNPNDVRYAVHTLLAMENQSGGIGPQVSAIAREFNNSANNALQLEERIRNRDAISRFFFGGDKTAAREMAELSVRNQERIRILQNITGSSEISDEIRVAAEEQIRTLEQNNARWQQEALQEQNVSGIFSWLG